MCDLINPDCLHCPYPECDVNYEDIKRQWRANKEQKLKDSADSIKERIGVKPKSIILTNPYQQKYEQSEKGKERRARYVNSEKGRETQKRYNESEKGRERWRRYYRKTHPRNTEAV